MLNKPCRTIVSLSLLLASLALLPRLASATNLVSDDQDQADLSAIVQPVFAIKLEPSNYNTGKIEVQLNGGIKRGKHAGNGGSNLSVSMPNLPESATWSMGNDWQVWVANNFAQDWAVTAAQQGNPGHAAIAYKVHDRNTSFNTAPGQADNPVTGTTPGTDMTTVGSGYLAMSANTPYKLVGSADNTSDVTPVPAKQLARYQPQLTTTNDPTGFWFRFGATNKQDGTLAANTGLNWSIVFTITEAL